MKKYLLLVVLLLYFSQGVFAANPALNIEINIPECKLRVYQAGTLLYEAPVGIGRMGHETPTGEFTVVNKIVSPTWYPKGKEPVPAGPTNPLGNYWLGLNLKGYGIHGNINPDSIGTPVSLGCIRMHNDDIEVMYHLIEIGTQVRISYQTIVFSGEGESLSFKIFPDVYGYGTTSIFTFLEQIKDPVVKDEIFVPYLAALLQTKNEETISVPFKVNYMYNGHLYQNIGFKQGKITYFDPRAITELLSGEEVLKSYIQEKIERYIPIEEVEARLLYHRIRVEGTTIVIETKV